LKGLMMLNRYSITAIVLMAVVIGSYVIQFYLNCNTTYRHQSRLKVLVSTQRQ